MSLKPTPLEQELHSFIQNQFIPAESPITFKDDDDLIELGILDSLAVMQLVMHVEETYQLSADTGDIVAENFGSVKGLAQFITLKQPAKQLH